MSWKTLEANATTHGRRVLYCSQRKFLQGSIARPSVYLKCIALRRELRLRRMPFARHRVLTLRAGDAGVTRYS